MANVRVHIGPQGERTAASGVATRVRRAWAVASPLTKALAIVAAAAAVVATLDDRVSLGSGLAVAAMVIAALVDVAERRIPDAVTLMAGGVLIVFGVAPTLLGAEADLGAAAVGAGMMASPLLVIHVVAPDAMGFGDVKAAVVLGAATGLVHWQLPFVALAAGSAATAIVGLARRERHVAFGPGLVGGSLLALVLVDTFVPRDETLAVLGSIHV